MKRKLLLAGVLAIACVISAILLIPGPTYNATPMANATNEYRQQRGLPRLSDSKKLAKSAQEKADTLCRTGQWSHESGNEAFYEAINRAGYDYSKVGENLAKGYETEEAFNALVNSPTHRANIVGDYKEIGVGYSDCNGKKYYVIHYGKQ